MGRSKHFIYWVLFFVMVISLPIGIMGCRSPIASPEEPTTLPTTPTPTSTPTPANTPAPAHESAPPDNPLAKIAEITGDVLMKKADTVSWIEAKVDESLKPGDSVKTSDKSKALILFFEGSAIELAPNTEIRISKLSINEETKSTTIELWQEIGKTKSRVEKLIDSDSLYQINTPHTAAVVRGSTGDVTVFADYTQIFNIEGHWYALVNGELVIIPEGYTFMILSNGSYYYLINGYATNPQSCTGSGIGGQGSNNSSGGRIGGGKTGN